MIAVIAWRAKGTAAVIPATTATVPVSAALSATGSTAAKGVDGKGKGVSQNYQRGSKRHSLFNEKSQNQQIEKGKI
ncbi:hypothetical protein, partial [Hydrogenispora ethanolica]|uniref:hypothetical protein n=1 Tax=Hydrogenispora ethanolica TaxID=1082276 RepID=UPI001A9F721A